MHEETTSNLNIMLAFLLYAANPMEIPLLLAKTLKSLSLTEIILQSAIFFTFGLWIGDNDEFVASKLASLRIASDARAPTSDEKSEIISSLLCYLQQFALIADALFNDVYKNSLVLFSPGACIRRPKDELNSSSKVHRA